MNINRHKLEDFAITILIGIALWIAMFFALGYSKYGIYTPLYYDSDEAMLFYANIKGIFDNGWYFENRYLGAPFSQSLYDYSAFFLMNVECLLAKLLHILFDDVITVFNVYYLLIFSLCGMISYLVMRCLLFRRWIATSFSVLFALSPYIIARNLNHFPLTTCYFVPLSVLLCMWCFMPDEDYLKINRSFFHNKRNPWTLLFAVLIANNGEGYYQVFSCMFLLISGICSIIVTRRIKSACAALKTILVIFLAFITALVPTFVYHCSHGSNPMAVYRDPSSVEIFGLKICSFFIPVNSHGIGLISALIDKYYDNMLLISDNAYAYLGLAGIIGFIYAILLLFRLPKLIGGNSMDGVNYNSEQIKYLLPRLIIVAILIATIGGIASLIAMVTVIIRAFNRISIYILYFSLLLCALLASEWIYDLKAVEKRNHIGPFIRLCFVGFLLFLSVIDLMPSYGSNDARFECNIDMYKDNKELVSQIETMLDKDAMVWQMPYHQQPDSGVYRNEMPEKALFDPYISSHELRWSYGGMKFRESDAWGGYVSTLPLKTQIDALCTAGFTGIYIETRAYTDDELYELCSELSDILKVEYIESDNQLWRFYEMKSYVDEHEYLLSEDMITIEEAGGTPFITDK